MLISLAYGLTCKLLGAVATVAHAELLLRRHENTVLRRQIVRARYEGATSEP
jgi:Flp pilus assembly protein protease CpaA